MKYIKIYAFIAIIAIIGIFIACTDENNENGESQHEVIKSGIYSGDLVLAIEASRGPSINTKGLNPDGGYFTGEYPYNYIYIHSADNKTLEEGHQVLKVNLKEVEHCNGCKGINLQVEVNDNEDGSYTIRTENNPTGIQISTGGEVYFSTIATPQWEAEVSGNSPLSSSDVFIQSDANKELLRSVKDEENTDYNLDDLINLLQDTDPKIEMERHCTGFRTYFMFTYSDPTSTICNISATQWEKYFGSTFDKFYIKLYLGPNFCEKYDIYNNVVHDSEDAGYYVTGNQQYQPFGRVYYNSGSSGTSDPDEEESVTYGGYGYQTDASNYLLAPLNTNINASEFSIYAFIKYAPNGYENNPYFLTSDEGAYWFRTNISGMTLDTNIIHWLIISFDVSDLKKLADLIMEETSSVTSRSIVNGFKKFDIKPFKVIVY